MANTFRPKEEEKLVAKQTVEPSKPKAKARPKPQPKSQTVKNKSVSKVVKAFRRGFESVFGGGILRKMNVRKNWAFILMIVIMIIFLIYSNLKIQSKRQQINKLIQDIVIAKDEVMDAMEKGYDIDKQKEREVLQRGEESGFTNSGYIPYTIEAEKKTIND